MCSTPPSGGCRWFLGSALLLGILLVGCSRGPTQNLAAARTALQTALDSWKNGEAAEALQSRNPAIAFTDDDYRAGHKLVSYEIAEVRSAPEVVHCSASLSVQDRRGRTHSRKVVYAVALKNPVVIARDPYF